MIKKKKFQKLGILVNEVLNKLERVCQNEFNDIAIKNDDFETVNKLQYHFRNMDKDIDEILYILDPDPHKDDKNYNPYKKK